MAAARLCRGFRWDATQAFHLNLERAEKKIQPRYREASERIIDRASDRCSQEFVEYLDYRERVRAFTEYEDELGPPKRSGGGSAGAGSSGGLTPDLVDEVGSVGVMYGYLYRDDRQEFRAFALVVKGDCQEVDSGASTWDRLTAEAIADGAAPSDAEGMNDYLRSTFCPQLGY